MKRLKDYLKKKRERVINYTLYTKKKYINYYWKFLLFYYEDYIKFKRD